MTQNQCTSNTRFNIAATSLYNATTRGETKIVKLLLKQGADPNFVCNGYTPLFQAALFGCPQITEELLKHGANPNCVCHNKTPLGVAIYRGYTKVVEDLLEHGADANYICGTIPLLHREFEEGYFDIARYLWIHEVDVNSANNYYTEGSTPLYLAALRGHEDAVKLLLVYKANVNAKQRNGSTALDASIQLKHFRVVDVLLKSEEEIKGMKREKIGYSTVSFHDIFSSSMNQLSVYAMNENIVQVLKSDYYKFKFPIYASMIKHRFMKGIERRDLLQQGSKLLSSLLRNFRELPQNCTEKILQFISDKHLRVLVEANK